MVTLMNVAAGWVSRCGDHSVHSRYIAGLPGAVASSGINTYIRCHLEPKLSIENVTNCPCGSVAQPDKAHLATPCTTINCMWFIALIASLVAALGGVYAKRWCHECLRWLSTESLRSSGCPLRTSPGLRTSWMPLTIPAITFVLTLSFALLLAGISVLAWTTQPWVTAAMVTVAVAITVLFSVIAAVVPVVIWSGSYRIVQSLRSEYWVCYTLLTRVQ